MCIFFFNDTATTEIYTYGHTLSLHDALPIYRRRRRSVAAYRGPPAARRTAANRAGHAGWRQRRTTWRRAPPAHAISLVDRDELRRNGRVDRVDALDVLRPRLRQLLHLLGILRGDRKSTRLNSRH